MGVPMEYLVVLAIIAVILIVVGWLIFRFGYEAGVSATRLEYQKRIMEQEDYSSSLPPRKSKRTMWD